MAFTKFSHMGSKDPYITRSALYIQLAIVNVGITTSDLWKHFPESQEENFR